MLKCELEQRLPDYAKLWDIMNDALNKNRQNKKERYIYSWLRDGVDGDLSAEKKKPTPRLYSRRLERMPPPSSTKPVASSPVRSMQPAPANTVSAPKIAARLEKIPGTNDYAYVSPSGDRQLVKGGSRQAPLLQNNVINNNIIINNIHHHHYGSDKGSKQKAGTKVSSSRSPPKDTKKNKPEVIVVEVEKDRKRKKDTRNKPASKTGSTPKKASTQRPKTVKR